MYVVVVGGLLFLAFAYFAFAQAAVARNGAQSAADAAALAAAQEVRDEMADGFLDAVGKPDELIEWLDGKRFEGTGEAAAVRLAGENESDLVNLAVRVDGYPEFEADVKTRYTVGDSVIPDTENIKAEAGATAVIEPLCTVTPDSDLVKLVEIDCEGSGQWKIDPKDLDEAELPDPNDLFSVHLAE